MSEPTYTVGEASRFFFARSAAWLRAYDTFTSRDINGYRIYTLGRIETLASDMFETEVITDYAYRCARRVIESQRLLHGQQVQAGESP